MEEERLCAVRFEWSRDDDVNENIIKECFEYAKGVCLKYSGVYFEVIDYELCIILFFSFWKLQTVLQLMQQQFLSM